MTTRRQTIQRIAARLESLYGAHEARQIALIITAEHEEVGVAKLLADPEALLATNIPEQTIRQLESGRPLQYVLGYTECCGLRIGVREGVLIPRPETEELIARIATEHPTADRILDIGTGSGCIALALKHKIPMADVFATDISEQALSIAHENAATLKLDITFRRADALRNLIEVFPEQFDVIVSNPPYIPQQERSQMRRNVTDFEPELALFVPDHDPLRFYRAIARAACHMLTPYGALYFEIHEAFGEPLCDMLRVEGFARVDLHHDINDKPRMICCLKNP